MTTTILLIGHGSRLEAGNREIERFADLWRQKHPDKRIELCFIEFADRLLDEGLDLAANGSTKVIAVPLILNAAGHVKAEIPHHVSQACARHPGVEFHIARHLGANGKTLKILKRKLHGALQELHMPDPRTTGVILLGRGSSDRLANGENAKLARYLYEESGHELVDAAFTGICYPRLESAVQRQVKLAMTQIIVLPYYLFAGTLMERIKNQMEGLQVQYPQIRFALAGAMGFDEEIFDLLDQRVDEALAGIEHQCDCCHDPEVATPHHHHHHHHQERAS